MKFLLLHGDCVARMKELDTGSIPAIVCDPPYELSFMSKKWDGTGIAFSNDFWSEVFRVLRQGGVVKAFGGTRTFHRMAQAMESVGLIDVHLMSWCYGSGFPKSLNIAKALDQSEYKRRERLLKDALREKGFTSVLWSNDHE